MIASCYNPWYGREYCCRCRCCKKGACHYCSGRQPQQQYHQAKAIVPLSACGEACVLPHHRKAEVSATFDCLRPGDLGEEHCIWVQASIPLLHPGKPPLLQLSTSLRGSRGFCCSCWSWNVRFGGCVSLHLTTPTTHRKQAQALQF